MSTPGLILLFGFSGGFRARRIDGLGSRIGRRPTAERPKVLDANLVRRMLVSAEKDAETLSGVVGLLHRRCPGCRRCPYWVSVIPSPRPGGMECGATTRSAGSNSKGRPRQSGGHDRYDPYRS